MIEANAIERHRDADEILIGKCGLEGFEKIRALESKPVSDFIARYLDLCNPRTVFVRGRSGDDAAYIRRRSVERGEEIPLDIEGHTVHFDGYNDQARDKGNTKFLLEPGDELGSSFNSTDRDAGLSEIHGYLRDIMRGKEAYVCFFCLGPADSEFCIPALQITDSAYVAHSEDLLYRDGYDLFTKARIADEEGFFKFVHSAGALDGCVSRDIERRRIYTDLRTNTIFSVNTQYGGNTIGAKKLAMRLAIRKADREGWLTEHMFIMGVNGPEGRTSYFAGAFPSACGKTSTSMIEGETLVGDDIAYLREIDGEMRAANPERGVFGIIRDVNPEDDPLIWEAVTSPGEVILSNLLAYEGKPYWLGMGCEVPETGINHSGKWWKGKRDQEGEVITLAHRNSRYAVRISDLGNMDPNLDNPRGVRIKGLIYGARDADTWLPVQEAFDWDHGVITMGAVLESETTFATLGKAGLRKFSPMANLDFLSIPIGKYVRNHLEFGRRLRDTPSIFSVNYFLRDGKGNYLNQIEDKRVWLKWMELRANGDLGAIETPVGYSPIYQDLEDLFWSVLQRGYTREEYEAQFRVRVQENLLKIKRMTELYRTEVRDTPSLLFTILEQQRNRLIEARKEFGDYISPSVFEEPPEVPAHEVTPAMPASPK